MVYGQTKHDYKIFQSYNSSIKTPSESSSHAQHLGLYQRGTGQPPVWMFVYKCKMDLRFIIDIIDIQANQHKELLTGLTVR